MSATTPAISRPKRRTRSASRRRRKRFHFTFSPCGRRCLREAKADEGSLTAETDPSSVALSSASALQSAPPSPTRGEREEKRGAAMGFVEKGAVRIHYEEAGTGYPL